MSMAARLPSRRRGRLLLLKGQQTVQQLCRHHGCFGLCNGPALLDIRTTTNNNREVGYPLRPRHLLPVLLFPLPRPRSQRSRNPLLLWQLPGRFPLPLKKTWIQPSQVSALRKKRQPIKRLAPEFSKGSKSPRRMKSHPRRLHHISMEETLRPESMLDPFLPWPPPATTNSCPSINHLKAIKAPPAASNSGLRDSGLRHRTTLVISYPTLKWATKDLPTVSMQQPVLPPRFLTIPCIMPANKTFLHNPLLRQRRAGPHLMAQCHPTHPHTMAVAEMSTLDLHQSAITSINSTEKAFTLRTLLNNNNQVQALAMPNRDRTLAPTIPITTVAINPKIVPTLHHPRQAATRRLPRVGHESGLFVLVP